MMTMKGTPSMEVQSDILVKSKVLGGSSYVGFTYSVSLDGQKAKMYRRKD